MIHLRRYLPQPPSFVDEDRNHLAGLLHYGMLLAMAITAPYAVIAVLFAKDISGPALSGLMFFVSLARYRLLHKGNFRLASASLIFPSYGALMDRPQ